MSLHRLLVGGAAGLLLTVPVRASAQTDYRNLDDDRPGLIEDAYPIERWAAEFIVPFRAELARGGGRTLVAVPELTYGALADVHIGLKVPIAAAREGTGPSRTGPAGLRAFALWNANTESGGLPALAVRADVILPVGVLAQSRSVVQVKGLATRSFGLTRVHLNASAALGPLGTPAAAEGAARWFAGASVDRTFWRRGALALAEFVVQRTDAGVPVTGTLLVGGRLQLNPMLVLDLGAGRDLVGPARRTILTAGLTRAFAIDGLMRRVP